MKKFSLEQAARLILAEICVESTSGNYIFDDNELEHKFGIESEADKHAVVDAIDTLYPEVLLDDPFTYSGPGELSFNVGTRYVLHSEWEPQEMATEDVTYVTVMQALHAAHVDYMAANKRLDKANVQLVSTLRLAELAAGRRAA